MKHLTITYNNVVLWDAPVGELSWQESDNGVKVEGRVKAAAKTGGGGGLLDMLTGMSKAATAQKANQLREEANPVEDLAEVEEVEPVEVS